MVQEKFNNKQMLLLTLLLVACLSAVSVSCRPSSVEAEKTLSVDPSEYPGNLPEETIRKVQQCEINQTTMELCMRCAKVTRSEIIYPMCCNNDDSVKDWCYDYVYYGNSN
ncbi:uncharacterized protein LOC133844459 [Drosophila sulfurigaster albostrigata]|uniref:uncharacterized protein LOC133844459 n=1 Tax=Drosophila sulfurigaster albostrigata TaxID=89887 RepID=UPI002D219AB3|nr:uncharacterized protein LOC133844459 [Drosophila sulfurigaster albostrigata]